MTLVLELQDKIWLMDTLEEMALTFHEKFLHDAKQANQFKEVTQSNP